MKLWVIRHGESQTNAAHMHSGWFQASLTKKGTEQAIRAGDFLKDVSFDRVISSDLIRAIETAHLALPGCEPKQETLIREINVGSLQGRLVSECLETYGQPYVENKRRGDYTPYGGENHEMHMERIRAFMKKAESFSGDNIAVFTHEHVLRAMLDIVLGEEQQKSRIACNNCCIGVFEFGGDIWRLYGWHNII